MLKKSRLGVAKPTFPTKIIWIPSCLDLIEHITRNIATTLIAASAAQMLKSTSVVFAALFSVVYLKNKLYRHHFSAIGIIVLGTGLVGVALIIEGGNNNKSKSLVTGIVLMLIGQCFGSASYTSEEKIMELYPDAHPLQIIAYEGLWMTLVWLVLIPSFQFIPCSSKDLCSGRVIEDSWQALDDYKNHPI
jgi:drug/metabolite transporter (DMT)-like permease